MRASQLDAARLDVELTAMLQEQFMKVFTYFQPRVVTALQPELSLILQLLVSRQLKAIPAPCQTRACTL